VLPFDSPFRKGGGQAGLAGDLKGWHIDSKQNPSPAIYYFYNEAGTPFAKGRIYP
jgi:hypothetical protein